MKKEMMWVLVLLFFVLTPVSFADEIEQPEIAPAPAQEAPAVPDISKLPSVISGTGTEGVGTTPIQSTYQTFVQQLSLNAAEFRAELSGIASEEERAKKTEEYKAKTAQKIKEFLSTSQKQ